MEYNLRMDGQQTRTENRSSHSFSVQNLYVQSLLPGGPSPARNFPHRLSLVDVRVPREVPDPSNVLQGNITRTVTGTVKMDAGNSSFYSKQGIVSMNEKRESGSDRSSAGSSVIKVKKMSKIFDGSTKFPKLQECAHFHYDVVELSNIKVRLRDEDQENIHRGESVTEEDGSPRDICADYVFFIQVSSQERTWTVRRSYKDLCMLDRQLHRCIYDRKYSLLVELHDMALQHHQLEGIRKDVSLYLQRFSSIASSMINCGPVLSWFEMDNRGNRLIVTDESAINTPAVAAAHVTKRYTSQAPDEISFEVGDIISIIDMPPDKESIWWRGKRNFEVGFFPCECVEIIRENVPDAMTSKIPQTPPKAVLRKRGKLISFLRTFFTQRPARSQLKRSGIVKERVFGCDLGENLLNSGLDVPLILTTCACGIEEHGICDGIYRLSGVASNIQKLRVEFDEEQVPNLSEDIFIQDIHSLSSVLKAYFRELPNPLLTYALYDKFAAAIQDEDSRLLRMHDVVQQLPPPHYRTAKYLLQHLHRVASFSKETGMHVKNLAIVWAPNLLRSKELEQQYTSAAALEGVCIQAIVTEFLISYVDVIFSDNFNNISSGGTAGRRPRPKSLAISTPTKLLSLEEARERALANSPQQKFIEVGGGPSNLPDQYHTIIELPNKKKSNKERKTGWKALFSRSRTSSWRNSKESNMTISELPDVTTRRPISPTSADGRPHFFADDQWGKHLRAVHSLDSLVSGSNRLSGHMSSDDATTIANPYTDDFEYHDKSAMKDRFTRNDSGRSSKKRSISCDEDTYNHSQKEPSTRPASDGSADISYISGQHDSSRHSLGLYYTETCVCSAELPEEAAPPLPARVSRSTHLRSKSSEEKTFPHKYSEPIESTAHSGLACSPPGDPKRSRPDYTSDEIQDNKVSDSKQKSYNKNKIKVASPSGKMKKKAPPPPISPTQLVTPLDSTESQQFSPAPLSAEDKRKPVTQLLGFEEMEMHGVEGAMPPALHSALPPGATETEKRQALHPLDLNTDMSAKSDQHTPQMSKFDDDLDSKDPIFPSPRFGQMDFVGEVSKSLDSILQGSGERMLVSPGDDSTYNIEVLNSDRIPSDSVSVSKEETNLSSMGSVASNGPGPLQIHTYNTHCDSYGSDSDVFLPNDLVSPGPSHSSGTASDYLSSPQSPFKTIDSVPATSTITPLDTSPCKSYPLHIPSDCISPPDEFCHNEHVEPPLEIVLSAYQSVAEEAVLQVSGAPVKQLKPLVESQGNCYMVAYGGAASADGMVTPSVGDGYFGDRSTSASPTNLAGEVASETRLLSVGSTPNVQSVSCEASPRKPTSDVDMVFHMDGFSDRGARSDSAENLSMSCDSCDELDEGKGVKSDCMNLLSSSGELLHASPPSVETVQTASGQALDDNDNQPPQKPSKPRSAAQRNRSIKDLLSKFETSSPQNIPPKEATKRKPAPRPHSQKSSLGTPGTDSSDDFFNSALAKCADVSGMEMSPASSVLENVELVTFSDSHNSVDSTQAKDEEAAPNVLDKVRQFEFSKSSDSLHRSGLHSLDRSSLKNLVKPFSEVSDSSAQSITKDSESHQSLLRDPNQKEQLPNLVQEVAVMEKAAQPVSKSAEEEEDKPLTLADRKRLFQLESSSHSHDETLTQDSISDTKQRESLSARLKRLSDQRRMYEEAENNPKPRRQQDQMKKLAHVKAEPKPTPTNVCEVKDKRGVMNQQGGFVQRHSAGSREDLTSVGLLLAQGEPQEKPPLSQRKKLFESGADTERNTVKNSNTNSSNHNTKQSSVKTSQGSGHAHDKKMADKVKQFSCKSIVVEPVHKDTPAQAHHKGAGVKADNQCEEKSTKVSVKGLSQMFEKH